MKHVRSTLTIARNRVSSEFPIFTKIFIPYSMVRFERRAKMKSTYFISFITFVIISLAILNNTHGGKKYVSNLSAVCLRCICTASTQCNKTVGCQKDYCGPFLINKEYWREAARPTLKDDDPDRTNAFKDCANDYACASTAVENYMSKFGYDCNNDGVTDCDDYARLHFLGKDKCASSLTNTNFGRRYEVCRPVPSFPNEQ